MNSEMKHSTRINKQNGNRDNQRPEPGGYHMGTDADLRFGFGYEYGSDPKV